MSEQPRVLHHSGEVMWWTNAPMTEITLDAENMEIGVPFAYNLAGMWFVAVKTNEDGNLRIYTLPDPHRSFRERLRRLFGAQP